jgi:hypothetical protein
MSSDIVVLSVEGEFVGLQVLLSLPFAAILHSSLPSHVDQVRSKDKERV